MIDDMNKYASTLNRTLKGSVQPFGNEIAKMQRGFKAGTVDVTALKHLNSQLKLTEGQLKAINTSQVKLDKLVSLPKNLSSKVQQSITDIQELVKSGASAFDISKAIDKVSTRIEKLGSQTTSAMKKSINEMTAYQAKLKELGSTAFSGEIKANKTAVTKGTADQGNIAAQNARIKDNIAAYEKLAQVEAKLGLVSKATTAQQAKLVASIAKMRQQVQDGGGVKAISTELEKANGEYKQLSNTVSTATERMAGNMLNLYNSIKNLNGNGIDKLASGVAKLQAQINSGSVDQSFLTGLKQDITAAARSVENFQKRTDRLGKNFRELYKGMNEQVNSFRLQISKRQSFATTEELAKATEKLKLKEKELVDYARLQSKASKATNLTEQEMDELSTALQRGQQRLEKFKDSARKAKDELAASRSKMKGFKNALGTISLYGGATAVIFKLVQGVQALTKAAVQYDKAWRTIAAVTDLNAVAARGLQDQLVGLGVQYGETAESLSTVALELARAGTATNELATATEITIKLAALTGDTVESSTKAVVSYNTVFKSATLSTEQLGDKLAYMANQSRLSTQDINTFSNYALTAAKSVGFTVDQVGALAISLSNAGNNASTIGTQIRRFATTLTDTDTSVKTSSNLLG